MKVSHTVFESLTLGSCNLEKHWQSEQRMGSSWSIFTLEGLKVNSGERYLILFLITATRTTPPTTRTTNNSNSQKKGNENKKIPTN